MRLSLAILFTVWWQFAFGQAAAAQTIVESHDTSALGLTIYPQDLAMVTEVRTVDVPKGISEIRFHGVTDMIVPETAVLQSFEGLRLEGNFNSDLISRASLLQNAVGETITLRRLNPATGAFDLIDAELVSAANIGQNIQGAVFKTDAGLEALQCSGLAETLIFSKLPDKLNPIPMLSMTVSAEQAGPKEITLTYLTKGMGWEADYRMDVKSGVQEDETGASLLGWLTLTNETSKRFEDAQLSVVAGRVNRAPDWRPPPLNTNAAVFIPTCGDSVTRRSRDEIVVTGARSRFTETVVVQEASSELVSVDGLIVERTPAAVVQKTVSVRSATSEELGDYKLYRAPQSVTVNAHQTKQIAFLLKPDIEFDRVHKRSINLRQLTQRSTRPVPTDVEYDIDNSRDGTLAQPLPKGTLRLMTETQEGQSLFSGEGPVENLAVDLPFELKLAESFLVMSQFDFETIEAAEGLILKLSTEIQNASDESILAEVEFPGLPLDVIENSNFARDIEEDLPTYRFPVGPETIQSLVLDIPIEETGVFSHSPRKFKNMRMNPPRYINTIPVSNYRFRGRLENERFLSVLAKRDPMRSVRLTAKELSVKNIETEIEEREEKFFFENSHDVPLDIAFRYFVENGQVSLVESSIAPESEGAISWNLTVPADSKLVLTTTTRLEQ